MNFPPNSKRIPRFLFLNNLSIIIYIVSKDKERVLTAGLPRLIELCSKLEALYCLHLPVIRAVEISFRSPDMGVTHQSLNSSKVNPIIQ